MSHGANTSASARPRYRGTLIEDEPGAAAPVWEKICSESRSTVSASGFTNSGRKFTLQSDLSAMQRRIFIMRNVVFAAAIVGLMPFVMAAPASAAYTVNALTNASLNTPLDTGVTLDAGTIYTFSVENAATTIWSAGNDIPFPRTSTAAGIDPALYGTLTQNGFTANFGALVGEAGSTFFLIGTGASMSGLSGDLKLMYWDTTFTDNSGIQTVDVSAAPEPATWAMLIAGFAGLGLAMRLKSPIDARA